MKLFLALLLLSACDVSLAPSGGAGTTTATLPFEAALATLSGSLEDFESGTLSASTSAPACLKTYDCNNARLVTTYTNCATPYSSTFNGSTELDFNPSLACLAHAAAQTPADGTTLSRSYPALNRADSDLVNTAVTSTGFVTTTYLGGVGHLSITQVTRSYSGSGFSPANALVLSSLGQASIIHSGTLALGTRQVSSGALNVTNNSTSATYSMTLSTLQWGTKSCCYPTAGTMVAILSGSTTATGSESIAFQSTCGQVKFTDNKGDVSTVNLLRGCE